MVAIARRERKGILEDFVDGMGRYFIAEDAEKGREKRL